jgi:hypothetical protein
VPHPSTWTNAIAWVDDIASDQAIGACGAKMGRLAELYQAGVNLPKGSPPGSRRPRLPSAPRSAAAR